MTTRDLGHVALFAALIVALGIVPAIPLAGGVPITLQSMGVMLAGLVLGPKRGAAAVLVVLVLVAVGLPVLAGGRGGIGVFAGPTAGFLVGFVPGAFVAGWLAGRLEPRASSVAGRAAWLALAAIVGGLGIVHAGGIAWLAFATKAGLVKALFIDLPFVPGDLAKAVIAALVTVKVRDAISIERT